jgi:hypothetical protein
VWFTSDIAAISYGPDWLGCEERIMKRVVWICFLLLALAGAQPGVSHATSASSQGASTGDGGHPSYFEGTAPEFDAGGGAVAGVTGDPDDIIEGNKSYSGSESFDGREHGGHRPWLLNLLSEMLESLIRLRP